MLKYYLLLIIRNLSKLFFLFPMKENQVLFYSFSGKEYSCSPKYICEFLNNKCDKRYIIVWAVNKPERFAYLKDRGYKVIKYKSLKHMYYSATSRIIVTNTGPFKAVANRRNQEIINTWHGGGAYKKTGMDNPYKDKYQLLYNKNLGQAGVTLFISSSKMFTKYAIRGAFGYQGPVLECGLPRNDVLLDSGVINQIRKRTREKIKIDDSIGLVLYAPTWRNYDLDSYEKLDVTRVLDGLRGNSKRDWIFAFRGHNLSNGIECNNDNDCINVTDYPDMQELLIAADILISDYSSCIWDYSLLKKPGFLFVPDLSKYTSCFSFYTPIEKWGFLVARSNNELVDYMTDNKHDYRSDIEANHSYFQSTESGMATKTVVDYILNLTTLEA